MTDYYDTNALLELLFKALEDKRKPCNTADKMKQLTQWKREEGKSGMRASWG